MTKRLLIAIFIAAVSAILPDTWTTVTTQPTLVRGSSACLIGTDIFVSGGQNGGTMYDTLEKYDTLLDAWATKQNSAIPRMGTTAGAVGSDCYYAAGLLSPTTFYQHHQKYSPAADTWTTVSALPTGRQHSGSATLGDDIYVAGGLFASTSFLVSVERYSASADTWTTVADLPAARGWLAMFSAAPVLYAMGGNVATVLKYTPTADTWVYVTSKPGAWSRGQSAVVSGYLGILFGGTDPYSTLNSAKVQLYDITTDQWTSGTNFPSGKHLQTVIAVGASVYSFGGLVDHTSERYQATEPIAVTADPDFCSFGGVRAHLDLHEGIFQVVSSPTLVVNILVQRVATMPPEQDMFIGMVGIAANLTGCLVLMDCVVSDVGVVDCSSVTYSNTNQPCVVPFASGPGLVNLALPDMVITVEGYRATLAGVSSRPRTGFATHLDVSFTPLSGFNHSLATGILRDIDTQGVEAVQAGVADYEVTSGCLFALTVPSSASFSDNVLEKWLCQTG